MAKKTDICTQCWLCRATFVPLCPLSFLHLSFLYHFLHSFKGVCVTIILFLGGHDFFSGSWGLSLSYLDCLNFLFVSVFLFWRYCSKNLNVIYVPQVFGNAPPSSMTEKFSDLLQFTTQVSRLMVTEIRRRASNKSTGETSDGGIYTYEPATCCKQRSVIVRLVAFISRNCITSCHEEDVAVCPPPSPWCHCGWVCFLYGFTREDKHARGDSSTGRLFPFL